MATNTNILKGLDGVMKNLVKEVEKIENRTIQGLIAAVIIVRRDMEKTSPKTPVDLGNLRASFFTVTSNGQNGGSAAKFKGTSAGEMESNHALKLAAIGTEIKTSKNPIVVFGFSANYAMWVHENVGAKFNRPGSGAKFFEAAIERNKNEMIKVIAEYAKI